MEQVEQFIDNEGSRPRQAASGWEAWEAAPRDGPAVFVIDTERFDCGVVHGAWVDPTANPEELQEQLRQLLGREPQAGRWAIIDQIGLGPLMAPERLAIEELGGLIEETSSGVTPHE